MKTLVVLLLSSWLWHGAGSLRAEDAVVTSVRCLGLPTPTAETPSALSAFGGSALSFLVSVDAPLGTRLTLRADLLQATAGHLAVPWQTDVAVSGELSFETRTHLTAACTLPALPDVRRTTLAILRLRGVPATGNAPFAETTTEVRVYPAESPGEWKKTIAALLAQGGLNRLEIFGKGARLRRFLKDRQVVFEDGGGDWFAVPEPRTLYVGDDPPPLPARIASLDGVRLVLFQPPGTATLLPGVYQSSDNEGGVSVKVTLPDLLIHLPDDPRAQDTVASIFRQALSPRLSTISPTQNPNPP